MTEPLAEKARLTDDEQDRLICAFLPHDASCAHNMVPLFREVEQILAARQREWEAAVLRRCVETMPAEGQAPDFMRVVSTAMLALRTPPADGGGER